jgi:VIT1/CCC1 family predicted Fe2+/Mn2+ transporter
MLRGFGFDDAAAEIVALLVSGLVLSILGVILGRRYEQSR